MSPSDMPYQIQYRSVDECFLVQPPRALSFSVGPNIGLRDACLQSVLELDQHRVKLNHLIN